MARIALRLGLLLVGLVAGVIVIEIGLRLIFPGSLMGAGSQMQFGAGGQGQFQPDPECGYFPVVGNTVYDRYGCRLDNGRQLDNYDGTDRKGRQRVLFVGDSVTRRERTMRALQKLYGDQHFEYWNAGVESFNIEQELIFYRRVNRQLKPDQVILTFHNNDFQETPLVVQRDGKLEILFLAKDGTQVDSWWFNHSYLYRWMISIELGGMDRERRKQSTRQALLDWQQILQQDRSEFSVILLPILKPLDQWSEIELWSRKTALELLSELKIRHFDLLPSLERALAARVNVQETPDDTWHPSSRVATYFAEDLFAQKILTQR